jgi:hypothetical protein
MIISELISKIGSEIKVRELAEMYNVSERTIQSKIKALGFKWNASKGEYEFIGQDKSVFDLEIDSVFTSKGKRNNNVKKASRNIDSAKSEVASTKEVINTSRNESKNTSIKADKKEMDSIDILLAGGKSKRQYRGFYFDDDVLSIIDSVKGGGKSDLINEVLRKVFKEKGLL